MDSREADASQSAAGPLRLNNARKRSARRAPSSAISMSPDGAAGRLSAGIEHLLERDQVEPACNSRLCLRDADYGRLRFGMYQRGKSVVPNYTSRNASGANVVANMTALMSSCPV